MVVIVQMNGALFSLRKGASRFKASPRVNLTLLHCQAPQKWSNHLSVWSYRLSIGCSVAFPPLLESAPNRLLLGRCLSVGRAVHWRDITMGCSWTAISAPHSRFLSSSFGIFCFSPSFAPLKIQDGDLKEKKATQCCDPCEAIGESLGAAPHPLHIPQLSTWIEFIYLCYLIR